MRHLTVGMLLIAVGCSFAAADEAQDKESKNGYVYCSLSDKGKGGSVPVWLSQCLPPAGNLQCGQKVQVITRNGAWLKIVPDDGLERFIHTDAVSLQPDKFVGVDLPVGQDLPQCPRHTETAPRVLYAPDPEFPDHAGRKRLGGTVVLSLIVGLDGKPRNLHVERSLDRAFDKKAIEAVKRWRFQPATSDGKPIEKPANVEVLFLVRD